MLIDLLKAAAFLIYVLIAILAISIKRKFRKRIQAHSDGRTRSSAQLQRSTTYAG